MPDIPFSGLRSGRPLSHLPVFRLVAALVAACFIAPLQAADPTYLYWPDGDGTSDNDSYFGRDVDFDGEIILADISKKSGGHFDPHKSHQAGRDIDIWLPTLKGVYKTKYLDDGRTRPRKPHFEEVDWYATWGLVRALIQTGAVKYIFLDWRYQKYVYDAAVNMGATREQLDEWIQYPRHQSSPRGIFRHSQDHLSHIHVRFKCAQWESQCKGDRAPP